MQKPWNKSADVVKYANYLGLALKKATKKLRSGLLKSKPSAGPQQPIDYVPITKRNGALEIAARTVTGENWD